jgi:hypothetical protein
MKPHPPGAVASLVLGILAVIGGWVPVLGLVLGIIAITSAKRATSAILATPETYEPGGLHTAGLVTGTIGLVMSTLSTLWFLMMIGMISAVVAAAASGAPMTPTNMEKPLLW